MRRYEPSQLASLGAGLVSLVVPWKITPAGSVQPLATVDVPEGWVYVPVDQTTLSVQPRYVLCRPDQLSAVRKILETT